MEERINDERGWKREVRRGIREKDQEEWRRGMEEKQTLEMCRVSQTKKWESWLGKGWEGKMVFTLESSGLKNLMRDGC